MWNDFQIGDSVDANTAVWVSGYNISHNQYEYWWQSQEYDIGGRINKNSETGITVTEMIYANANPNDVDMFMLRKAFELIPPATLLEKFQRLQSRAFEAGREVKAAEIRLCLGL